MLRSLTSAVSGLQNLQQQMDVIGNNVANVNTLGYKGARADFADAFNQTLRAGGNGNASTVQVGTGVSTSAIRTLNIQGALVKSALPTDLAIEGNGYFVVRDTISNTQYVTRAGNFLVDTDDYLITTNGYRVQGYSDSGLATRGDIRIDTTGKPATADPNATLKSYTVDNEGKVQVTLSDGVRFTRGQILMQNFRNPEALAREGHNLYSNIGAAGPLGGEASPTPAAAGTNGLGYVRASSLELSNVDLAKEFSDLIVTQRAFQASARIISTSDEMLQEMVNLKR